MYVVFGATGGIGSELCRRLSQQTGAQLVMAGRDAVKLETLRARFDGAEAAVCDPLSTDEVRAVHGCYGRATAWQGKLPLS